MIKYRVFINTISWYIGTSTDFYLKRRFKGLEKLYPELSFYYPKSLLVPVFYNFRRLFFAVLRKTKIYVPKSNHGLNIPLLAPYHLKEFQNGKFDIIYSQGVFPINIGDIPVVYDAFFLKLDQCKLNVSREELDSYDHVKQVLDEIVKKNVVINFRSNKSIKDATKFWPEYSYKFVNIPFLLPDLKALSEEQIKNKHSNIHKIRILFVGAQAKRKGLQLLLDALSELWNEGYTDFELNVVSACSDGKIIFPSNIPCVNYGKRSYDFVMNLYKQCQVYAMVSHFESFGISYIEAQANGLISLLRDFEPQREIADYGRLGFLAKPEVNDIKDKLKRIFQLSDNERIEMALACRLNFLDKYEYRVVANQWHKAFMHFKNE